MQHHQMQSDLSPAMHVQAAAAEAAKLCPNGIDVLINNAGGLRSGNAFGLLQCGNSFGRCDVPVIQERNL